MMDPSTDLRSYRDTIARALLSRPSQGGEPFAYLLEADMGGALLHVPSLGQPLVMIDVAEGADLEPVRERMLHLARQTPTSGTHIVAIGGGQPARELLTTLDAGPRSSLHQVMEDGSVPQLASPSMPRSGTKKTRASFQYTFIRGPTVNFMSDQRPIEAHVSTTRPVRSTWTARAFFSFPSSRIERQSSLGSPLSCPMVLPSSSQVNGTSVV